jgi:hypothetical protein
LPGEGPGREPTVLKVDLDVRFSAYQFLGFMKLPEGATGRAKVTLSFPDWKEGEVSPATFEVPVVGQRKK